MRVQSPDSWQAVRSHLDRLWTSSAEFLRERFAPESLLTVGIHSRSVAAALLLTGLFFTVVNGCHTRIIERTFAEYRIGELQGAADSREAAEWLIELGWADARLRSWLEKQFSPDPGGRPAHEQLLILFEGDLSASAGIRRERQERLHDLVTGRRHGWWPLVVRSESTSGGEVFTALSEADDGLWIDALEKGEFPAEKREFLSRYADQLVSGVHPAVRDLRRVSGWIQWLTVGVALLLILVIGCRVALQARLRRAARTAAAILRRIPSSGDDGDAEPRPSADRLSSRAPVELTPELAAIAARAGAESCEPSRAADEERQLEADIARLGNELESRVYGPLGALAALLPSLGFIGTVLGMGKALLGADGLLTSADKQQAVGEMTRHLGYAFDTTLVALAAGLLTVVLLCWCRGRELRFLDEFKEQLLTGTRLRCAALEPTGRSLT